MTRTKKTGGFTLIELLVVITIIAILAALVLNVAGFIQKKAARARAEAEIQALSTALESYKVEYGDYPENSSTGAAGSMVLYNALVLSNSNNPSGKVFYEPSKGGLATSNYLSSTNYFMDPFGVSYEYRYVAGTNGSNYSGKGFFDLWSFGGVSGTKTSTNGTNNWVFWVKNW